MCRLEEWSPPAEGDLGRNRTRLIVHLAASGDMPVPTEASPTRHEVQKGDTLFSVARRYGLSVAELSQVNPNLNGSLKTGQTLRLPLSAQASGETAVIQPASFKVSLRRPAQPVRYTVKRGGTLHSIAQRFNISLADIRSLNPDFRKHSAIHAGQRVVVSRP